MITQIRIEELDSTSRNGWRYTKAEIDEVVEEAITIEIDTLVVEDADWVELHPLVEPRELEDSSAEPEKVKSWLLLWHLCLEDKYHTY